MPLIVESVPPRVAPGFAPPERLLTWAIEGDDGIRRRAWLVLPPRQTAAAPLVLSPHPFGFTALGNLFGEPAGLRTLGDVAGIGPVAARLGMAVLTIESEGRVYSNASLGWRSHLDAYAIAVDQIASSDWGVDASRAVACGLSMGGHESLMLAIRSPTLVRAVAVQNAVTDLVAWYRGSLGNPASDDHAKALETEVGALPEDDASVWDERSPFALVAQFPRIPVQVRFNDLDAIVPSASQSRPFVEALEQGGIDVDAIEQLPPRLDAADPGRSAHEYADWSGMLGWLAAQ